jgi:tetratricopeptide (TPR) repeat protein
MIAPRPDSSCRRRARPLRALAAICALAMAGCTTANVALLDDEELQAIASPTNIASLSDVVRRNPNDPQAYNMRGSVYGRAGRYQEALEDFNQAIRIDPKYAQAYANRALVHREMKRPDRALADFNRAIELDPNYSAAYVGRGIIYRQQGRHSNQSRECAGAP